MRVFTPYGSSNISTMPGCNQVAISHGTYVKKPLRGKGYGGKEHRARINLMQQMGYDYAIQTVASDNEVQKKILVKNGWKPLADFFSSQTNHHIELWGRKIQQ